MLRYMIMRKADAGSEAGPPSAEQLQAINRYRDEMRRAGVLRVDADLRPSSQGVRVHFGDGAQRIVNGPFDGDQLLASFGMIEVASRQEAIEWIKRWPVQDANGEALVELRESGCPGGVQEVQAPTEMRDFAKIRYAVLLKSDAAMEADRIAEQPRLDAMTHRNQQGMASGELLGGEGLQSSAKGMRVKFSRGRPAVIDGPFTEIKELVAGYWVIQARDIAQAIEWVTGYPYPMDDAVVEIRPLYERGDFEGMVEGVFDGMAGVAG
ncbi:YciI family protein [Lysobacter fragariae]